MNAPALPTPPLPAADARTTAFDTRTEKARHLYAAWGAAHRHATATAGAAVAIVVLPGDGSRARADFVDASPADLARAAAVLLGNCGMMLAAVQAPPAETQLLQATVGNARAAILAVLDPPAPAAAQAAGGEG